MDRRWYATLAQLKRAKAETSTDNDTRLSVQLAAASDFLEKVTGSYWIPVTATRYFDAPEDAGEDIWLDKDCLSITSIVDDGGTVTASYYELWPYNEPSGRKIRLVDSRAYWYWSDSRRKAIAVSGVWGRSQDTLVTGATVQGGGINASVTTMTVDDGDLLEIGMTLLIETEQIFVSAITDETITIERAQNGTTAAAHAADAAISYYVPNPSATKVVIALADFWYDLDGKQGIREERIGDTQFKYVDSRPVPDSILTDIQVLARYV